MARRFQASPLTRRTRPLMITSAMVIIVLLTATACGGDTASGVGVIEWPGVAEAEVGPVVGLLAPNFSLLTAAGESLTLAEQTGSPLLLNFFASWCASCREELAILEQASRDGTSVIGVDLREKPEVVQALAAETETTFPLALDRSGEVTRAYRVVNLPVTFLLDEEARVVAMVRGPLSEEKLRALLATVTNAPGET